MEMIVSICMNFLSELPNVYFGSGTARVSLGTVYIPYKQKDWQ